MSDTGALDRLGFILDWLVSGPAVHPFSMKNDCVDQLAYEAKLRRHVRNEDYGYPDSIVLGEPYIELHPWRYSFTYGNGFVQFKRHGIGTHRVDAAAAVVILAPEDMEISAAIFTYASLDVWLNAQKIMVVESGAYKPVIRKETVFRLHKGRNMLLVRLQALGVRDTRSMFAVQLPQDRGLKTELPDSEHTKPIMEAAQWLRQLRYANGTLHFASPPCEAQIGTDSLSGKTTYDVGKAMRLTVTASVAGQTLSRTLEFAQNVCSEFQEEPDDVALARRNMYRTIGKQEKVPRGPGTYFAAYNILARYAVGEQSTLDYDLIYNDLDVMERRLDCSEFVAAALLRLTREYDIGTAARQELKRVFLNYRYWMDEAGEDGMCFWSENHALMFYGVQMLAGAMWPDEQFTRSGRKGREQFEIGRRRCNEWLDDVLANGFEEFLSANYMNVTMGALVNLIDYGPEEISVKARKVLDEQFRQIGTQTFDGSIIAPQGRVYREAIYPFRQDSQGLLHYLDRHNPFCSTSDSWWLSVLATSSYHIPDEMVRKLTDAQIETTYESGNACIYVKKTPSYMITGVQCPSLRPRRWQNTCRGEEKNVGTNAYTKSLNEKFHGASYLMPGQYGYMQHFGYMALSREAVVFTNHPGIAGEDGSMRPGYWFANGVMPAQRLSGDTVGQIYCIDETHPLGFVHLYFPSVKFDRWLFADGWLFAQAKRGYIAVWCSEALEAYDDMLFDCEWRAYGRKVAFLGRIASEEMGTFEAFQAACKQLVPVFDREKLTLETAEGFSMRFVAQRDDTQYLG